MRGRDMAPMVDVRMREGEPMGRQPQRTCEEPGCGWITKGGKPYCFRHVLQNPEAAALRPDAQGRATCECGRLVPSNRSVNCSPGCEAQRQRVAKRDRERARRRRERRRVAS